ncbi:hypothetical protein [Lentzea sp. NPDC060358]|uniref:hypothetical protein n=1 Tax=Lentzea sp. NPDC060358 TaxID=3347103 RepID=UPI003661A2C6
MHDEQWPQSVAGWELVRDGRHETYRKRLANGITVDARWDGESGEVEARADPAGVGRTLASSRREFRDKEAFFTAARLVVDMAANLPSFRMGAVTHAEHVLTGEVAGTVDAMPGSGGVPEAELRFTLTDGRSVTLVLTEEQADDLTSSIYSISKHVWSEYHEDDTAEDDVGEDEREPVPDAAEVPDVSEVDAGPDTPHELMVVLEQRFGVTRDFLMAHVDWSAVLVVGEPAVSALLDRADELADAIAPAWFPGAVERPGEVWVVLHRAFAG